MQSESITIFSFMKYYWTKVYITIISNWLSQMIDCLSTRSWQQSLYKLVKIFLSKQTQFAYYTKTITLQFSVQHNYERGHPRYNPTIVCSKMAKLIDLDIQNEKYNMDEWRKQMSHEGEKLGWPLAGKLKMEDLKIYSTSKCLCHHKSFSGFCVNTIYCESTFIR